MKFTCIILFFLSINACKDSQKQTDKSSKIIEEKAGETFISIAPRLALNLMPSNYDSLSQLLVGIKMDKFKFVDINGNIVDLNNINKPILLEATATWCKPCKYLNPTISSIAEQYEEEVEVLFLMHDTQEKALKLSETLSEAVTVVPSERKPNMKEKIIAGGFVQVFPFPTSYFIDINKTIVDVRIGAPVPDDDSVQELERIDQWNTEDMMISLKKILEF